MTFSGDVIALAFYFSCTHKYKCACTCYMHTLHRFVSSWSSCAWKNLLSLSECRRSIPHIHPLIYLSKLHVSCYLWWDSGELCDLSSFSLIIAVMRIKALKLAVYTLLVGLFIHIHEDGRIWGLLGCQYINLGYLSLPLALSRSFSYERLEGSGGR